MTTFQQRPGPAEVVANAEKIIRLPKSAIRIYDLAGNEDSTLNEIASAIEIDPAFAAQILRLCNSAIYSRGIVVADVQSAVRRLGRSEIRQLAFMLAFGPAVSSLESELMTVTSYWEHSVMTGVLARHIARHCELKSDAVFCAGLIHDIGLQVLFSLMSNEMIMVLERSLDFDEALVISEQETMGYDHTIIGEELAKLWNLPAPIQAATRNHHNPALEQTYPRVTAVVAMANIISSAHYHSRDDEADEIIIEQSTKILGPALDTLNFNRVKTAAHAEAEEMLALLE